MMIILKFGGTSVSTKERLETIVSIVKQKRAEQPVVVVSAIRAVTDLLLDVQTVSRNKRQPILNQIKDMYALLATETITKKRLENFMHYLESSILEIKAQLNSPERTKKVSDAIVSYGEILAAKLVALTFEEYNITAQQIVATRIIVSNREFGNAEFLPEETKIQTKKVILPLVKKNIVPVVTGFIGATERQETTTLGRGGSDYSAAIIGFALDAQEVQIWTDVDGIFSADPRAIPDAQLLPTVSYREASELAAFGAKVLHPRTIRPAITAAIPVRVLNTLHPTALGTLITNREKKLSHVVGIASKSRVTLVNLYATDMLLSKGFLARVFAIFALQSISVDLVSVSEVSVSISLDNEENLSAALMELSTFCTVTTRNDVGIVSLIGEGIVSIPHILPTIFTMLDTTQIPVQMISLGATDINISLVIPHEHIENALTVLHAALVTKTVHRQTQQFQQIFLMKEEEER